MWIRERSNTIKKSGEVERRKKDQPKEESKCKRKGLKHIDPRIAFQPAGGNTAPGTVDYGNLLHYRLTYR